MSATTATVGAPFILPADSHQRYLAMQARVGTFIRIQSGDFHIAGTLLTVLRPAGEADSPIVTILVHGERILGPVLVGDSLV